MTKLLLLVIAVLFSTAVFTQNLYKVPNSNLNQVEKAFKIKKHYENDVFSLISLPDNALSKSQLVAKDFDPQNQDYYLVWLPKKEKVNYIDLLREKSEILYFDTELAIVSADLNQVQRIPHGINSGIIKISEKPINTIKALNRIRGKDVTKSIAIENMVDQVVTDTIMASIQHMQDYGTRKYNTPEAVEAQSWIQSKFESYGLATELTYAGVTGSENVIAYQPGMVYNNKYVVVGGHYDSTSYGGDAPGADDNASGTAGVMEIARILSQYQFNYTIIYCAWSAEEIGLYGSGEWASTAASEGMDIIGYLNLDMIGYLQPGGEFHTDMMAPSSAQPLVDIYEAVAAEYMPDFTVYDGTMIGGDSDHTSFNNNGYMGIFPFEDSNDYSPYIHSEADTIGTSVNNPELVRKFTQVGLAFMATMAEEFNGLFPPMNLSAEQAEEQVTLTWNSPINPDDFEKYYIYRNSTKYDSLIDISDTVYVDSDVANGNTYEYFITAKYAGSVNGESNASNSVSLTIGLLQTHIWDFEDGMQEWTFENDEAGWMYNVSVGLSGNSTKYMSIDSDDVGSGTHTAGYAISPQIDLNSATIAFLEFDYGYRDYGSDEFSLMYRTSSNQEWVLIQDLGASTSFIHYSVELPEEAYTSTTQIAFHYDDNNTWAWYAAFDNVEVVQAQSNNPFEAPMQLEATLVENAIELSWQPVVETDFIAYKIYRFGDVIETISSIDQTSFIDDNNLIDGVEYTYYVTANYTGGESDPSNIETIVFEATGVQGVDGEDFKVYPNPASVSDEIHVNTAYVVCKIQLFDMSGKLIFEEHNTNILNLNNKDIEKGIYTIKTIGKYKSDSYNVIIN